MKRRIVFTGGGTAGHVYPGLSVIESLRKKDKDIEIIWIGSARGMEKDIIEAAGVEFRGIPSGKLRRYFSLQNFTDLFRIIAGLIKAFFIIGSFKPLLVFSKGGFVSVPPVAAAGLRKIPVFSHESDATPGLATKLNTRFSDKVFVSYEKTRAYFPEGKAVLTGNPVRSAVFNGDADAGRRLIIKAAELSVTDKKILMIIGGSQGALQINMLIESLLPQLAEKYLIVHQTGKHQFKGTMPSGYIRHEYIGKELPDYMAAADLIVSRAGASTLWEAAALGRPAILIPLGSGASRGDQQVNAEIFRDAGASVVLEGEVTSKQLENEIDRIMNNDKLRKEMSDSAMALVNGNPADLLADYILERLS